MFWQEWSGKNNNVKAFLYMGILKFIMKNSKKKY